MSEINVLLSKCQAGIWEGYIESCIVVAHDNGYVATATNAAEELAELRADLIQAIRLRSFGSIYEEDGGECERNNC